MHKFEDTGCTCDKPRFGRPTISGDVVMEVHHTVTAEHRETAKGGNLVVVVGMSNRARVGYPKHNGPQALALGTSHVSLSVPARPNVGAG